MFSDSANGEPLLTAEFRKLMCRDHEFHWENMLKERMMNIFSLLKKRYDKEIGQRDDEIRGRRQLNMTVDERLIDEGKRLAAEFATPRYVIVEHGLQVAYFYLDKILRNPGKRETVHRHLINDHLLDSGFDDTEEILRIGEGRYSSKLLSLAKGVIRECNSLRAAMVIAKKTGKTGEFDVARKDLLKSAVTLADWLRTHPLDEPDREDMEDLEEDYSR